MTVLITLGVMAVCYSFMSVVRLQKQANDLQYQLVDEIRNLDQKVNNMEEDIHRDYDKRINEWVASTDRRFDYMRNDLDKLNKKKKK